AHGGERAASCWKCGYLKYKAKAGLVPGQMHEATLEDTFQLPGHFKRITRTREGERESVMVFVANDGKLWTKIGDAPAELGDNDFSARAEHPFADFCPLARLTERAARLTRLATEKVSGRTVIGVRVHTDELVDIDLHFDTETWLLLKINKVVPNAITAKAS